MMIPHCHLSYCIILRIKGNDNICKNFGTGKTPCTRMYIAITLVCYYLCVIHKVFTFSISFTVHYTPVVSWPFHRSENWGWERWSSPVADHKSLKEPEASSLALSSTATRTGSESHRVCPEGPEASAHTSGSEPQRDTPGRDNRRVDPGLF